MICTAAPATETPRASAGHPNIIYVLADDLGYGELGCYGQKLIKTPNIDRLAKEGIKLTDHYAGAPLCAPSRCVFLTGLHTGHCPIRNNRPLKHEGNLPIPKKYPTLGEIMKKAGYATGAFGKWGEGFPGSEGDPVNRGFDRFYGYNCQRQAHSYYPDHLWSNKKKVILEGNAKGQKKQYSHDLIANEALAFIRKNGDKPFFVYVPFTIPHTKLEVPDLGEYAKTDWSEGQKTQAAMITRMDRDVGRIMNLVKEIGADDNTLIIFTSDNGPHGAAGTLKKFNAAGLFRAKKGSVYEGGIRVPFVARWPGHIKPGSVSDHVSCFQDMMPTFADLAGVPAPKKIDGISMVPTLLGKDGQKTHDYLYWELGAKQAVRMADWKAVRIGKKAKRGKRGDGGAKPPAIELYNLADDPGEAHDVADKHPEVVKQMKKTLKEARTPSKLFPNKILDK
jgi:arylsulfatase A-like enzyme